MLTLHRQIRLYKQLQWWLGGAIVLLIVGIRGVIPDPTRPT